MKAQSEQQQKAAGAALSAKRGETDIDDLYGASKRLYENLTEAELEEIASVSHDELPTKKQEYQ